jgi:hypothetical protein
MTRIENRTGLKIWSKEDRETEKKQNGELKVFSTS